MEDFKGKWIRREKVVEVECSCGVVSGCYAATILQNATQLRSQQKYILELRNRDKFPSSIFRPVFYNDTSFVIE
jgi:hypothetical protein